MEAIGETMASKADADPTVQKAGILEMAGLYLKGADPRSPLAAPLYADLTVDENMVKSAISAREQGTASKR